MLDDSWRRFDWSAKSCNILLQFCYSRLFKTWITAGTAADGFQLLWDITSTSKSQQEPLKFVLLDCNSAFTFNALLVEESVKQKGKKLRNWIKTSLKYKKIILLKKRN